MVHPGVISRLAWLTAIPAPLSGHTGSAVGPYPGPVCTGGGCQHEAQEGEAADADQHPLPGRQPPPVRSPHVPHCWDVQPGAAAAHGVAAAPSSCWAALYARVRLMGAWASGTSLAGPIWPGGASSGFRRAVCWYL